MNRSTLQREIMPTPTSVEERMEPERNRRILIVDDSRDIHADFRKILVRERHGQLDELESALFGAPDDAAQAIPTFEIDSAYQGQDGCDMVRQAVAEQRPYALAFIDMRMPPGIDGVETVRRIFEIDDQIQIVICTAYSDYSWEQIVAAFAGTDRLLILKKPFDTVEVSQLACALTEKWHLAKHAHLKLNQLTALVDEKTQALRLANQGLQAEVEERLRSENALRVSETRYALAAAGARDALWDWDQGDGLIYFSPRWREMLGKDGLEVRLTLEQWCETIHPEDVANVKKHIELHLAGDAEHLEFEYRVLHASDKVRWILCRGQAFRDAKGIVQRIAGSQTDITDRKLAEEQLRVAALHDALTGLPNRALLYDRLERCIYRSQRDPSQHFALLFLDLDRFKVVNDSLGHLIGDELLIQTGRRIVSSLRATDTLANGGPVARLGGDEFVVLLEGIHTPTDALRVAERILRALDEPIVVRGHELRVAASIGVSMSHTGYQRPDDMLRDADTAMYQAKSNGKGRIELFDPNMRMLALSRWRIESDLSRAIQENELVVEYQPVVHLGTGHVHSVEALVRWKHAERGIIKPDEFIPLAEETGHVIAIGQQVLDQACAQMKRWESEVPRVNGLAVAVNVSSKQFARPEFAEMVIATLRRHGLASRRLQLEITESALMDMTDNIKNNLKALRDAGIRLHIDDFGTGYSSLSYLQRIKIDSIKIDRSFVSDMNADPTSASIVHVIVALARALGVSVIAEGIETLAQKVQLEGLGCDLGQGWYFHRAISADQVTQLLRAEGSPRAVKLAGD